MKYFVISHTGNVKREVRETGEMRDGMPVIKMHIVEDTREFFVEEAEVIDTDMYGGVTLSNGREFSYESVRFESGIYKNRKDAEDHLSYLKEYGEAPSPFPEYRTGGVAEYGAE